MILNNTFNVDKELQKARTRIHALIDLEFDVGFLVYQVGCIECGVTSYPVQLVTTQDKAEKVSEEHPSTWSTEGGDGYTTIINLKNCRKRVYPEVLI